MTRNSKIALGLVSLPLVGIMSFIASFHIGARIAAAPMKKLQASIETGMSHAEVQALVREYGGVTDQDSREAALQIGQIGRNVTQISQISRNLTSPLLGSWSCFLHVQMGANGVESSDDVFCVD